ncbi:Vasohibin-1 [Channa argus]|uniref:Vasohibin-1 n=1 Tax=Channa argus TaxID=215402 RepID=A0A6G1QFG6_CHAAH|nr:Vasohibin-1 [Channa argus]
MLKATVNSVEERDEEQEDEGDEELRDGGVPFYINRGGFPVDDETWERMWRHVARIHANGEALGKEIRGATDLPRYSYLTNNMPGVERFPLSFKSQFSGNHFHHIVLGLHIGGRFGALGMSRREDLMFKRLEFRTLMDLVQEFDGAYRGYWHTLRKVKIGQYVSHDPHSVEQIEWKHSILDLDKLTKEELRKELDRHTRDMRLKIGKPAPPSPTKERRNIMGSPLRGPSSPIRRISRVERRPSGEKKVLEQKASADMNGYQIRV